ncbi:Peptide chain release factor 1-like, mitochondrial [Araneus ventricosus]|uniref:Peptide chain release factor 1-like, mitochondrial n=1 Tax=Araneus ventricosus TaxID=182803 RepID=A0A4Y2QH10_ARAVE|nr:Peptide chain release factor 1-like, mitochondrial [Araneus ventricosus]
MLQWIIPSEIVDDKDIIMELTPGVGGQEAMLFTKHMFDMYCRYANWKGWKAEILRHDTTDLGGIRSAHIAISGHNAFKVLKFEGGVHRVQRVPKTEKAGRLHTSTMTVAVIPQPSEIDIVIHPSDIELEFKRSGGAGGQHVNTTDSCVRIYHKASGIVTESQMERNQHRNRELAMKALRAKLYERELQAIVKETTTARKIQIGTAARSEKVRTYNFAQDRITDHRAHLTVHDVQSFLRGEDDFDYFSNMLQQWYNLQSLTEILNKYET